MKTTLALLTLTLIAATANARPLREGEPDPTGQYGVIQDIHASNCEQFNGNLGVVKVTFKVTGNRIQARTNNNPWLDCSAGNFGEYNCNGKFKNNNPHSHFSAYEGVTYRNGSVYLTWKFTSNNGHSCMVNFSNE